MPRRWRSYAGTSVYYGSLLPYPLEYLPAHTTFDLSLGKTRTTKLSPSLNVLEASNLDNGLTCSRFHWNYPREIYLHLQYKFH